MNNKLRLILDFGPLLVFFLAYQLGSRGIIGDHWHSRTHWYTGPEEAQAALAVPPGPGLMPATLALIVFTLISLAITYKIERRIAVMPLVSGILITIFGGLTLYLQDETFIKMKPTVINLLFASVLLGGVYVGKPMLKYLLNDAIHLTEDGWKKLSLRWGFFFVFLAGLNEFIWRHFPTDFWVNFKVFGMFTLTMLFTLSQLPLMKKYWNEPSPPP